MKKRVAYILTFISGMALLAVSCSEAVPTPEGEIITLSAAVNTKAASTVNLYTDTAPSESAPLVADVWFSTTAGSYPGNSVGTSNGVSDDGLSIDSHRTVTYTGPNPTTPSGIGDTYLRYPSDGTPVNCVGLYPQGIWGTTDGSSASAVIDGSSDIMFAAEISGSNNDKLTYKPQDYKHLLTLVKLRARSEDVETASTWGNIRSITIEAKDKVEINLSSGAATFSNTGAADHAYAFFTGDQAMTTTSSEFGSLLLAPVVADGGAGAEYVLHIECEKYSKDISLSLDDESGAAFSGSTAGRVFVVTLRFHTLSYVEGGVELKKWEEEYRDIILN